MFSRDKREGKGNFPYPGVLGEWGGGDSMVSHQNKVGFGYFKDKEREGTFFKTVVLVEF